VSTTSGALRSVRCASTKGETDRPTCAAARSNAASPARRQRLAADVDVDLDRLAEVTASMSGATLADLVYEAAIIPACETLGDHAGRSGRRQLRAIAGPEKKNRT
jgi:hypothetical protein